MVFESSSRIVLAILLILILTYFGYASFRVHGAILGTIGGAALALFLAGFSIKEILASKEKSADVNNIYKYVFPVFFFTLVISAFTGLDVIIAKIVFDPDTAGAYAIASVLGKVIFLGTSPISKAMFPITSSESERGKGKNSQKIFMNSLWMVIALAAIALVVIFFFSETLIYIFSGKSIPLANSVLLYVGLAASFVSIANLLLLYKLSTGKTRGYSWLFIFLLAEIGLLFFFSQSILMFSLAFLSAAIIFLIGSIILVLR